MKTHFTLSRRTNSSNIPFFKGTLAQCLWKLLRHCVNLDTILVNETPSIDWIKGLPIKSFKFKTSITGSILHIQGNGNKCIKQAFARAERKFATTF